MDLKGKNILIIGLGISGVSTVKALNKLGSNIYILDRKKEEELRSFLYEIRDIDVELHLGTNDFTLENIDLIVKSPGVPLHLDIFKKAKEMGVEFITDIELAYRLRPNTRFIAITGTNGKTTTTSLIGEYFNKGGLLAYVVGNIGIGLLWDLMNSKDDDIFLVETSSFQLESTKEFKPYISLILNLAPDHLDWHGGFENYVKAKKKIFKNQTKDDFLILNYDDVHLRKIDREANSNIIWFSLDKKLTKGVYIEDNYVVINDGHKTTKVIDINNIMLPGQHNLENVLASICIAWIMNIDLKIVRQVLENFPGVEHRIEYVDSIKGIKFYNDSKGTNIDASMRAIEAIEKPIILIAGGMDKGSDFDELIKSFNNKVKALVLLGETKEKIKATAIKHGFNKVYLVENMDEAVKTSFKLGTKGDNILLSPACASWDMYPSFETRGEDFKASVKKIREEYNG